MRRLTVFCAVLALLVLSFPQYAAADESEGSDNGWHFGPYASGSTDSSTCGNDWANDTFKRVFKVTSVGGTWYLREDFKDGKFVTMAGNSPGGCETSGPHGSIVTAGIKGNFKGWEGGTVTGGTFNPTGGCGNPCNGTNFVATHFGAGASWNVMPFKFTYHADGPGLLYRFWQNASEDLGGNYGDIATN